MSGAIYPQAGAGAIITGAGSPEGVVAASPGAVYVDTASTNGASQWQKITGSAGVGWRVVYGDTGWRNINALVDPAYWLTADAGANASRNVWLRRVNERVTLNFIVDAGPSTVGTSYGTGIRPFLTLPAGFKNTNYNALGAATSSIGSVHLLSTTSSFGVVNVNSQSGAAGTWGAGSYLAGEISFNVGGGGFIGIPVAWPTTLPGNPA